MISLPIPSTSNKNVSCPNFPSVIFKVTSLLPNHYRRDDTNHYRRDDTNHYRRDDTNHYRRDDSDTNVIITRLNNILRYSNRKKKERYKFFIYA